MRHAGNNYCNSIISVNNTTLARLQRFTKTTRMKDQSQIYTSRCHFHSLYQHLLFIFSSYSNSKFTAWQNFSISVSLSCPIVCLVVLQIVYYWTNKDRQIDYDPVHQKSVHKQIINNQSKLSICELCTLPD